MAGLQKDESMTPSYLGSNLCFTFFGEWPHLTQHCQGRIIFIWKMEPIISMKWWNSTYKYLTQCLEPNTVVCAIRGDLYVPSLPSFRQHHTPILCRIPGLLLVPLGGLDVVWALEELAVLGTSVRSSQFVVFHVPYPATMRNPWLLGLLTLLIIQKFPAVFCFVFCC